jgi:DNA-binding response OmpR family regulator
VTKHRITFVTDHGVDDAVVVGLRGCGFDVVIESATVDPQRLIALAPDLLVLDIADASDGIKILKNVHAIAELKDPLILVMSEWGTGQATLALSHGAHGFERKPVEPSRLVAAIENLLRPNMVMIAGASED